MKIGKQIQNFTFGDRVKVIYEDILIENMEIFDFYVGCINPFLGIHIKSNEDIVYHLHKKGVIGMYVHQKELLQLNNPTIKEEVSFLSETNAYTKSNQQKIRTDFYGEPLTVNAFESTQPFISKKVKLSCYKKDKDSDFMYEGYVVSDNDRYTRLNNPLSFKEIKTNIETIYNQIVSNNIAVESSFFEQLKNDFEEINTISQQINMQ